jgi:Domain of Unknown Function (DUF1206)
LVTWAARHRGSRNAKYEGRRAANSQAMRFLARAGLVARGVMYVLIGWIAVQIAVGHSRQQADRAGALHAVAATPVGGIVLWLLVAGFIGMALWRLSEAIYGAPGQGRQKASARWASFARAVMYGVIAYGVLKFAIGAGAPQSSNKQSVDLTATAMKYPGGKFLVIVIGIVLVGAGIYLAYQAWRKEFLKGMRLGGAGRDSAGTLGARPGRGGPDHVRCLLVLRGKVAQALARPRPAVAMRRPRFCPAIPAGWNRIS